MSEKLKSIKFVNAKDEEVQFVYRCVDDKLVKMDFICCFESDVILDYLSDGFTGEVYTEIPSVILEKVNTFCVSRRKTINNFDDDDPILVAKTLHDFDRQFASNQSPYHLAQLMRVRH
uniref:uncharacterized protein LOC122605441 isoform X2 n=1 Tax=Erigeron canadensis TaxID=72917 RepID=UPI001CB8E9F9|nr:uncharacterized protein LOC122605441 isoform X2 [Erigeron canadensis]